jgi:hypothetical protein
MSVGVVHAHAVEVESVVLLEVGAELARPVSEQACEQD